MQHKNLWAAIKIALRRVYSIEVCIWKKWILHKLQHNIEKRSTNETQSKEIR